MQWWSGWKFAALDHGTYCISCHTALPYALARPGLGAALGEKGPGATELKLLNDVRLRVRLWRQANPYYTDQDLGAGKADQSRGTEAILNALVLVWNDARTGRLSDDARTALDNMWALQHVSGTDRGAWSWLDLNTAPWEVADAQYYGAALAALATGAAPESYRALPQVQEHLELLSEYLTRNFPTESLHHRLVLTWASIRLPGLLDADRRQSIIEAAVRAQNPDGGWSLSALIAPSSKSELLLDSASDGYATGLVTLVLEQAALPQQNAAVHRGLNWLVLNQRGHGGVWMRGQESFWIAQSLNEWRNPWSNVGRFMSDAATAYAVLALTESGHGESYATALH
jgi:squalene-hopene/tetraprenyl-beta-curcumene cyclase